MYSLRRKGSSRVFQKGYRTFGILKLAKGSPNYKNWKELLRLFYIFVMSSRKLKGYSTLHILLSLSVKSPKWSFISSPVKNSNEFLIFLGLVKTQNGSSQQKKIQRIQCQTCEFHLTSNQLINKAMMNYNITGQGSISDRIKKLHFTL